MYQSFDTLLDELTAEHGVSREVLGEVLSRVIIAAPEAVPRVDIANRTMLASQALPLSQATVSKAAAALLQARLLIEESPKAERPGRPIVPLALNAEGWGIIGVHVHHKAGRPVGLTGVLANLRSDVLDSEHVTLDGQSEADSVASLVHEVPLLAEKLKAAAAETGQPRQILGLGIEIGGHVDSGQVIDSTNAGWCRVDISAPLGKQLDLPVVVENDVNAIGVWETYKRRYPERDMAVVAVFDEGVGAALITGGSVYRGGHGMAGEVGHLTVDYTMTPDRPRPQRRPGHRPRFRDPCPCGRYGHVDALATPARILGELGVSDLERASRIPVKDRQGGRSAAARVFGIAGSALGRGLVSLIDVVNPSRLILLLPTALAEPAPSSAGAEYLRAAEHTVDEAFSTGADDARANGKHLTVHRLDRLDERAPEDEDIAVTGARAAAIRVVDAFVEHARRA